MAKSGLFKQWQARKSQIVAWYYRGRIGGGFVYWPDGPHEQPEDHHRRREGRPRALTRETHEVVLALSIALRLPWANRSAGERL